MRFVLVISLMLAAGCGLRLAAAEPKAPEAAVKTIDQVSALMLANVNAQLETLQARAETLQVRQQLLEMQAQQLLAAAYRTAGVSPAEYELSAAGQFVKKQTPAVVGQK